MKSPRTIRFFPTITLSLTLLPFFGVLSACHAGIKDGEVVKTEEAEVKVEVFAKGLQNPWAIEKLPDGRYLVTEKKGQIRVIENGELKPEPLEGMLPVRDRGQGGLMDLCLHPDFAKNNWLYISFSDPDDNNKQHTRIIRATLKGNQLTQITDIFTAPKEQYTGGGNHFGNRMAFDKDGYLFFGIGERGDQNKAQDFTYAQGGIHRVKDDGSIPGDNPFLDKPGAIKSLWTKGNRNPQGLRFNPLTGVLWETEHGPKGGDELNIIRKGANYGWPLITYGVNYSGTPVSDKTEAPGLEQPVTYYVPSIAISAVDFYTGDKFPAWKGNALIGALAHQKLTRVVLDGEKVTHQEIMLNGAGRMRDVRVFDDGYVYIVLDQGQILRLVPAN